MEYVTCTEESSPQCIVFWIDGIRHHVVQHDECSRSGAEDGTCNGCIPVGVKIIKFTLYARALV